MKTKAAVLRAQNLPLSVEELTLPQLQAGQVLIRIAFSGICHTQLSEVNGRKGPDRFLPHTLGHEGSGTVVALGTGVQKVAVGDHVVITWLKGSGADIQSVQYDSAQGKVNSGAVATFQNHAVVSENRLVVIPKTMPLREAALLGCAVPTGAGIVLNTLRVQAGQSVVIFGAGGIGLSALIAAKSVNAGPLIVVDIYDKRLAKARELGATHIINATKSDVLTDLRAICENGGADYAIESAGRIETMEAAFAAIRPGGTAILAGNLGAGEQIRINPFDLIRGKRLLGSWGGDSEPDRDIPRYLEGIVSGTMPFDRLIDREYTLASIDEALAALTSTTIGRAVISFEDV
jgi:S-(hydroxymethyl)glutathione dehydrogenase/alcohol dehydrogenase